MKMNECVNQIHQRTNSENTVTNNIEYMLIFSPRKFIFIRDKVLLVQVRRNEPWVNQSQSGVSCGFDHAARCQEIVHDRTFLFWFLLLIEVVSRVGVPSVSHCPNRKQLHSKMMFCQLSTMVGTHFAKLFCNFQWFLDCFLLFHFVVCIR